MNCCCWPPWLGAAVVIPDGKMKSPGCVQHQEAAPAGLAGDVYCSAHCESAAHDARSQENFPAMPADPAGIQHGQCHGIPPSLGTPARSHSRVTLTTNALCKLVSALQSAPRVYSQRPQGPCYAFKVFREFPRVTLRSSWCPQDPTKVFKMPLERSQMSPRCPSECPPSNSGHIRGQHPAGANCPVKCSLLPCSQFIAAWRESRRGTSTPQVFCALIPGSCGFVRNFIFCV